MRRYPTHLVAEVEVDSSFTCAGNQAFGILVAYISGPQQHPGQGGHDGPGGAAGVVHHDPDDLTRRSTTRRRDRSAPGGLRGATEFTLDPLPTPTDPRIKVRQVADEVAAVNGFTGRWTESIYQQQLAALRAAVEQAGLEVSGAPRFARFDPPWTPWFLRRNEVVLPISFSPGL